MIFSVITAAIIVQVSNGHSVRIVLDDDTPSPRIINLEEILIFKGNEKLSIGSLEISFTGGNALFPASLCNDENADSFCHSAIEYDHELSRFLQIEDNPSLVINSSSNTFDKIIVVNRLGFEERIVGAKIFVCNSHGGTLWTSTFHDAKQIYVFTVSTG